MNLQLRSEAASTTESQSSAFARFCEANGSGALSSPQALYAFSIADHGRFWDLFLRWSDPLRDGDPEPVCTDDRCEAAEFFPNLRLNYAENLLRARSPEDDERIAVVGRDGRGGARRLTRGELRDRVRTLAAHLRALGIGPGDRVAAIVGNNVEAMVAALAAATLGATFSSAAPEMGAAAILGRFEQLAPKLLVANLAGESLGAAGGLADRVTAVAAALPSLVAFLALDDGPIADELALPTLRLGEALATPPAEPLPDGWERFPFNHPLFILFTSGTTGPPKCIVHGAGGTLLEHLKEHRLHVDLGPEDTLFFQTSAAWMMWNWQLSALACGARVVVFDGTLGGPETLWRIVAEEEVTVFGTSPPYLQLCEETGYSPRREAPAPRLRTVLSTGSVLRDWQFDWVREEVGPVRLESISGGTDIVGCFVLGHPDLPVRRGMIQSRSLGLDVEALPTGTTPSGTAIGELICRNPFPSRPLGILGDDGRRFHEAYFAQNDGFWTHGDLIEIDEDGQSRIHGRSDGVLNIQGVRIGPSEIYAALRSVPEVREAMAVEQSRDAGARLVLLVVLAEGAQPGGDQTLRIRRVIARDTTPLHVPELVVAVDALPVTHSGKRSERAGRDAVGGDEAADDPTLANPDSIGQIRRAVAAAELAQLEESGRRAPAGAPTVERLRAIWETVLGVEPIADDDDFFAIGGTSLLAVRVFFGIEEQLGVELPLSFLLEAPTVAELAAVIDDPSKSSALLVRMRPGTGGPPLFVIHSIWGEVLGMRDVAVALRPDLTVYGIRARAFDPREEGPPTIERLAASYIEVIKAAQPEGPYRVTGHSFGALLAYEVARQLTEMGEEIGWLGLIDGELSTAALPRGRRIGHLLALPWHYARAALADPRGSLDTALHEILPGILRRGLTQLHLNSRLGEPPATWMQDAAAPARRMATANLEAAHAYRPRPYPGSMTYFVPTVRRFHLFADPLPTWRERTAGHVIVEGIPGPHVGMVSGDRGRIVAALIDRHLPAATG